MNIKIYLATFNMTMKELSQKLGCNHSYLSRISKGEILPGRRLAKDIKEVTGGLVMLQTKSLKSKEEKLLRELEALRREQVL